jgi:hypothetical protein
VLGDHPSYQGCHIGISRVNKLGTAAATHCAAVHAGLRPRARSSEAHEAGL